MTAPGRQRLAAEAELRTLAQALRAETQRADRAGGGMAELEHDLRAILGIAYGFCCNLRDELAGPLTDAQRTHVHRILDAVQSATALLAAARTGHASSWGRDRRSPTSARPERVQRSLVVLAKIAEEVIGLLHPAAQVRQTQLIGEYDETTCVWGDALKLKQVLLNLIGNAVKYTPPGGQVRVSVGWSAPCGAAGVQARRMVQVFVADTGPGIPRAWHERIFERGFRIPGQANVPGEGIGLFVVRQIIGQHGGTVRVENRDGGGAVFAISLPADLRERAGPSLMVLRQGEAAESLLRVLAASDPNAWLASSPRAASEITRLAAECNLAVLTASSRDAGLCGWLSRVTAVSAQSTNPADDAQEDSDP